LSAAASGGPHFLIIGGPNGSGKSSAYSQASAEAAGISFRIINPDRFAARLRDIERLDPGEANLQAVQRIEAWLETSILAGHDIGVETVLSTPKYRRLVTLAKRLGYSFHLLYVVLNSPQLNIERVRQRVLEGGHDVPEDRIIARYHKSLGQLPWFLAQADDARIYDNSGERIRVIGRKQNGTVLLTADALPAVVEAVGPIGSE
jgi:predicted ABC-type ATPase